MPAAIYNRLRISQIKDETPSARSYVLEPVGWNPQAVSGQFITLVFETRHGEKRRSYSLSSSPELGEPLQITIKKVENGEFSRRMLDTARVGDELYCSGVGGLFTLKDTHALHYFFLAAGSGVTPCYSILRTLLHTTDKKVTLIYSNRSETDAIFLKELFALNEKFPGRFSMSLLFSDRNNVYESRLSNWLLPQLLNKHLGHPETDAYFFLCGPYSYMQMAEITLLSDFKREQIRKENFDQWTRQVLPEPPDKSQHEVRVVYNGTEYHFPVQFPRSVLAEAKKMGINLPYSCEAGRCSACVGTCTSGKVWMAYNEVLTDREVQAGRVLVCQSYPLHGDVTIEIP